MIVFWTWFHLSHLNVGKNIIRSLHSFIWVLGNHHFHLLWRWLGLRLFLFLTFLSQTELVQQLWCFVVGIRLLLALGRLHFLFRFLLLDGFFLLVLLFHLLRGLLGPVFHDTFQVLLDFELFLLIGLGSLLDWLTYFPFLLPDFDANLVIIAENIAHKFVSRD